ncbi:tetratricopeptide repeat protein 4-like isoform X2 [Apostichopus japonicus]|uniref:tetratricopeptide repeat protein 4-like isoform X2 n=1 Tax=Stichopus japonicus TaxID=307972 RepID=UPI003AB5635D
MCRSLPFTDFDQHALFMTKEPTQEEIDASPTLSAIQAIKYAENDPEELALEHKEDGNYQFKKKMYRLAVKAYTEGIKQKCENTDLNAVLYTNRAAAHFHLENFLSSFNDAKRALRFKPDHMKAIFRCVDCCLKMRNYAEALQHCDSGLQIVPNEKSLLEKRATAVKQKKAQERDARKGKLEAKKVKAKQEKLLQAIKDRNVQLRKTATGEDNQTSVHPKKPTSYEDLVKCLRLDVMSEFNVTLNESGALQWPVRFLYPEHNQSDVISAFEENTRFIDHFVEMFKPGDEIPWDKDGTYTLDNIEVYFEEYDKGRLVTFNSENTLQEVLSDQRCHVYHGQPNFIVLSRASDFRDDYLHQYGQK